MEESENSRFSRVMPRVRVFGFLAGIGLVVFGAGIGVVKGSWDAGTWCMVLGGSLVHFTEIGRPLIVNMFTEEQQRGPHTNAGYL